MALLTRADQDCLNNLCDGELITCKVADSDVIQQLLLESSLPVSPFGQIVILNTFHEQVLCEVLGDGKIKNNNTNSADSTTTESDALA